jgi:hypothetical protein
MEYTIVQAYSPDSLTNAVKKLLAIGWVPSGGVAVGKSGSEGQIFYQTMTRQAGWKPR